MIPVSLRRDELRRKQQAFQTFSRHDSSELEAEAPVQINLWGSHLQSS